MADTSYILDGIKQAMIHYLNPSDMATNPVDGLKEKENLLKSMNVCVLRDLVDNFDELEDLVSNTIGNNYTSLLLGRLKESDLDKAIPILDLSDVIPAIGSSSSSSSGSTEIYTGSLTQIAASLVSDDWDINLFTQWDWVVLNAPENATVDISEYWSDIYSNTQEKVYHLIFSHPGFYTMSLRSTYPLINLYVQDIVRVQVF